MLYRINIERTEIYKGEVLVEAETPEEATKKIDEAWKEGDLFEKITENPYDAVTEFSDPEERESARKGLGVRMAKELREDGYSLR